MKQTSNTTASNKHTVQPLSKPKIVMDIEFLRPLAYHFQMQGYEGLPPRVANAVDSLIMILGVKI